MAEQRPTLAELSAQELWAQAHAYRDASRITASPRVADSLMRLAACCEALAASKEIVDRPLEIPVREPAMVS